MSNNFQKSFLVLCFFLSIFSNDLIYSQFNKDVIPEKKTTLTSRWQRGKLLYRDDFDKSLKNWIAELSNPDLSSVDIKNGELEAAIKGGATIWFKPELSGNILIEYDATVVSHSSNGANLNQFWMASDPNKGPVLFSRKGKFSEYDSLRLYYAGLGGNENTTSRFRKYLADGTKPVLQEYTDPAHFPVAGKKYTIQIIVYEGLTRLTVDGQNYFELNDPNPYTKGHFAFRTFQSKITIISKCTVWKLSKKRRNRKISDRPLFMNILILPTNEK